MDFYKSSVLVCLLAAICAVRSILLHKPIAHSGEVLYRLMALRPGRLDVLADIPVQSKLTQNLGKVHLNNQDHIVQCNLSILSPPRVIQITHEKKKPTPEGKTIQRDDQTLRKWTKGFDGRLIDTPHDKHEKILNEIHRRMHKTTPVEQQNQNDYPPGEVSTRKDNMVGPESTSESMKSNITSRRKNEDELSFPEVPEAKSATNNNRDETIVKHDIRNSAETRNATTDDTEPSPPTTSENNPDHIELSTDSVVYRSDDETSASIEDITGDYELPTPVSLQETNTPPAAVEKITQRIEPKTGKVPVLPNEELRENFLRSSEQKHRLQNQHRVNLAALRTIQPTSKETLVPNYFRTQNDPYGFYSNLRRIQPASTANPLGSQTFDRFLGFNMYNPQAYAPVYYRYGYNPLYPHLHQHQGLIRSPLEAQQRFYGYGHSGPSFDPGSLGSMYRYLNAFGNGLSAPAESPLTTTSRDVFTGGSHWYSARL